VSGLLQFSINRHPVAELAVWFEHCLELMPIDRSSNRHLAARRQLLARAPGQP
jgi:hypothetical protein